MPNLFRYQRRGRWFWGIDVWVKTRTGPKRFREKEIPTKEQAQARLAQAIHGAYEGRAFKLERASTLTVAKAWELYAGVNKRDCDSWRSDRARSTHLVRHLGRRLAVELGQADVDAYRALRLGETTKRLAPMPPTKPGEPPPERKHLPPSPATLDREVELLRRVLGYATKCGKLKANPLAGVQLLNVPNVREVVVDDQGFERLLGALERRSEWMRPVLLVAFDTGMRIGEVIHLLRERVDKKTGAIRLTPQETKTERGRVVYLQARTLEALKAIPVVLGTPWLFSNPRTRRPRTVPRRGFQKALTAAGLEGVHVHDLRRSFVTLARKRGIPESVVMKMSGHKTAAVFRRYNIVDETDVADAAKAMETAREGAGERTTAPQPSHDPATVRVLGGSGPRKS